MRSRKILSIVSAVSLSAVLMSALTVSSASSVRKGYIVYDYTLGERGTGYSLVIENRTNATSTYNIINGEDWAPYENSGVVRIRYDKGTTSTNDDTYATGFVVGDHTIATAAHCVYGKNARAFVTDMSIELFDNDGDYVETIDPEQAHIPSLYVNDAVSYFKYDYALIAVDDDLSDYEHFNLGVILDNAANSSTIPVNVAGYPSSNNYELYVGCGLFKNFYDTHIQYTADTYDGVSGGPVFLTQRYTIGSNPSALVRTAVAINTHGSTTFNQGVRITAPLIQFYLNNPNNTYEE